MMTKDDLSEMFQKRLTFKARSRPLQWPVS